MIPLITFCAWLLTLSLFLFALAAALRFYRRARRRHEAMTIESARRKMELSCVTERTQILDLAALRRIAQAAEEESASCRQRAA